MILIAVPLKPKASRSWFSRYLVYEKCVSSLSLMKITKVGGFTATLGGSKCLVLHNTTTEPFKTDLTNRGLTDFTVISGFVGLGTATLEGTVLTIEGQTSVVLR